MPAARKYLLSLRLSMESDAFVESSKKLKFNRNSKLAAEAKVEIERTVRQRVTGNSYGGKTNSVKKCVQ